MNDVFNTIKTNDGHVYIITYSIIWIAYICFARIDEYNRGCLCFLKYKRNLVWSMVCEQRCCFSMYYDWE